MLIGVFFFIIFFCRVLGNLFTEAKEVCGRVQNNKEHWEKISMLIGLKRGGSTAKMTFDEVLAMEEDEEAGPEEERHRRAGVTLNHALTNGSDVDV